MKPGRYWGRWNWAYKETCDANRCKYITKIGDGKPKPWPVKTESCDSFTTKAWGTKGYK